jgi:glutathione synthase/RimK-type ligase-like ATP-grasp enzyme
MTTLSVSRNTSGDPPPDGTTATRGIIGRRDDPQVASVADSLRRRGVEPVVLDLSRFPGDGSLSVRDGVPTARNLDLPAVVAWYVRSLPLPLPFRVPHEIHPDASRLRYAAGRERRSFLAGFVAAMQASGALFVNPPAVMAQHFRKLEQLDALRAAHVPVPATLATNDPWAVREFARDVGGALVYKPLAGGGRCRRVTGADLGPGRLRLLARAPVLFQAEIRGRNIRVYVVGGRVAAAYEIVSDQLDYRGAEIAVRSVLLGSAEADACLRAASACGMAFTGIDVRRRPDGSFAVLECNPSPMFAGIERRTGAAPVTEALTDVLERGVETRAGAVSWPGASVG